MAHDVESMMAFEEGRRSVAYPDSLGKPTIGIGHYDPTLIIGVTMWTDAQIDAQFAADLASARALCVHLCVSFGSLNDARQGALIGMAFQLGNKLAQFKGLLGAIRDCRWHDAWAEALDSDWAKETPARAQRMACQLRDGAWY